MRKHFWLPAALILLCLAGCTARPDTPTAPPTTDPPETSLATEPPTEQTDPTGIPTVTETPTQPPEGWQEENGQMRYYADGQPLTGWQTLDGIQYYFLDDGSMARGQVEIDGERYYFSSAGQPILLVNPWNFLPEDYTADLVALPTSLSTEGSQVDASCYDALVQMLTDCNQECPRACVVSSYRSYDYQVGLYNRKVSYYVNQGYPEEEAKALAATVVAVPGTSEHHTGLAVDIIDTRSWSLEEHQAELPAQQWLMENAWKYGFILRYPAEKTDSTGIIYEPWHYRYVGLAVAAELHATGETLEEYIQSLTRE